MFESRGFEMLIVKFCRKKRKGLQGTRGRRKTSQHDRERGKSLISDLQTTKANKLSNGKFQGRKSKKKHVLKK